MPLQNHLIFPPEVYFLAHTQLLSNEHSNTPSKFSFWTKAHLNTYKKEKGDTDHSPYSDLLCFLIVIPKFTLNYCWFALLKKFKLFIILGNKKFCSSDRQGFFSTNKNPFQFELLFTLFFTSD